MRYPHGDGSPDRHKAELYDLRNDPDQLKNLIGDPRHTETFERMRDELTRVMRELNQAPTRAAARFENAASPLPI